MSMQVATRVAGGMVLLGVAWALLTADCCAACTGVSPAAGGTACEIAGALPVAALGELAGIELSGSPECALDWILAAENFIQAAIFLTYYVNDPGDFQNLVAAYLTSVVAFSRYFDYLECLLEEDE